jgi:hypothetical protein
MLAGFKPSAAFGEPNVVVTAGLIKAAKASAAGFE